MATLSLWVLSKYFHCTDLLRVLKSWSIQQTWDCNLVILSTEFCSKYHSRNIPKVVILLFRGLFSFSYVRIFWFWESFYQRKHTQNIFLNEPFVLLSQPWWTVEQCFFFFFILWRSLSLRQMWFIICPNLSGKALKTVYL